MFDFSDRVVLITGAAGNLGSAIAYRFDRAGAILALTDRRSDRLERVCGELGKTAGHLLISSIELTEVESVETAVQQVLDRYGRIDVLVNTAGGFRSGTPVHETPVEDLDFLINLNVRTAFISAQTVVPHMIEAGSGVIINIGARSGLKGAANSGAYSASKSALIRLSESLSQELKHHGINVNCILPGTIDTPQNRESMPSADYRTWVKQDAIAEVILFLASDAARAIHGASIPVYGTG
jgi:NAD(P)-dependent dehydrogenase (short-subunit alcohol dehydrogenase family)